LDKKKIKKVSCIIVAMDSDRRQPGFALLLRWSGFLDTKNCKVYPVYKNPDIIEGKES